MVWPALIKKEEINDLQNIIPKDLQDLIVTLEKYFFLQWLILDFME